MTKEQRGRPKFTRREFLEGIAALALLGGCKPEKTSSPIQSSSPQPTPEPTKTPLKTPTIKEAATTIPPTPEPTPTKEEVLNIPSVVINEELLKKAFAGIGGGEEIEGEEESMSSVEFGEQYVAAAWNKKFSFEQLTEDPVASLKYMVALGAYTGVEGIYSPGEVSGKKVFPYLFEKGVNFLRIKIPEVPSGQEQQTAESQEGVMPIDLVLRRDTHLTVVGKFKGELISPALEDMEYALVASTDWFRKYTRREGSIAPCHCWGIIPVSLPGDPDNKKAFTLENLLAKGGVKYDKETGETAFTNKEGKSVVWRINEIKGEELIQSIKEDAGLWFVDQMKGEVIANPIVPYPPEDLELPAYWNGQRKEENGEVFISIEGSESMDKEPVEIAQARYDWETGEWRWKKIGVVSMVGVVEKDGEKFQMVEVNGRQEEVLKIEGLTLKWNEEKERFEYFDIDGQKVAHWVFSEEGEGPGSLEITPPVNKEGLRYLDFEKHLGLFAPLSAQESNDIFYRYWNQNQEIRIPIPLDIRQGGIVEEKKVSIYSLNFKNLKEETVVFSPIEIESSKGGFGKDKAWVLSFKKDDNSELVGFVFPPQGKFLASGYVGAGDPVIRLAGDYFPEKLALGLYKDYQLNISRSNRGEHISFRNLTKDSLGRITYLSGQ